MASRVLASSTLTLWRPIALTVKLVRWATSRPVDFGRAWILFVAGTLFVAPSNTHVATLDGDTTAHKGMRARTITVLSHWTAFIRGQQQ